MRTASMALLIVVDNQQGDPRRTGLVGLGRDADGLPAGHDLLALG